MNGQPIEVEDDTLVQAARDDRDAFDALYRRYVDQVYRYCYSRVGHRANAEDLTAQTFLAALQGLPEYNGRGSFAAWLFGIARHKCADHHRRAYANPGEPLAAAYAQPDTAAVDPERRALMSDMLDCVGRALHALTRDRREALRLRFWGGLSHREVAAIMERSEDAAKMLVWRAVRDLRERCLDEDEKS
ncbi:MAG: RNA polymerase sigma factor [Chloroflexota bacterium]|nr:RNA polymerase sigma factor [Chloroflexota bacterium]